MFQSDEIFVTDLKQQKSASFMTTFLPSEQIWVFLKFLQLLKEDKEMDLLVVLRM